MNKAEISLILLIFFLNLNLGISIETITPARPLKDGDVILSRGEVFALGFFSPGNSVCRYVGIWFNKVSEKTVVWVANRDNPLNNTSGILTINDQGNLVMYENNKSNVPLWSTKVDIRTKSSKAQLLDSGNLVLLNGSKRTWESFDYPTDTTVPTMKLGMNKKTGKSWFITSWKSRDDPGTGTISLKINPVGFPQVFLYNGSVPLWRGGPWTGQRWNGVPEMTRSPVFKPTFVNTDDEVSIIYNFIDSLASSMIFTRKVVNQSGILEQTAWTNNDWLNLWYGPKDPCDKYGKCGANSNCYTYDSSGNFTCKCLPGFVSKSNGSGECIRKTGVSMCRSGEGFVRLPMVKLPDTSIARAEMNMNLKDCGEECLKNCSCMAYTSADERGNGCLSWFGDLIDTKNYSNGGQELYIRVDTAELGVKSRGRTNERLAAIIIASGCAILFMSVLVIYCLIKKIRKARDKRRRRKYLFSFNKDSESGNGDDNDGAVSDLPLFDLDALAEATNNFSDDNKLGKGGFGSVYKGVLPGGKEIAVKRLSKYSGQGSEEFKNEVGLIAKLQHRNLVRILDVVFMAKRKCLSMNSYLIKAWTLLFLIKQKENF